MRPVTVAALTSQLVPEMSPLPAATWRALMRVPENEIQNFSYRSLPGQDLELIKSRLARVEEYEAMLQELSEAGIGFTTVFEPTYPHAWLEKLGDKAPSHLFTVGNIDLLQEPAVGVVGSRDLDQPGSAFAREVAEEIVRLDRVLVSGGARGVDELAMRAALVNGGRVVGILADALAKTMQKWPIDQGQICLVSPFAPSVGFNVGNAMARNKLIYASSQATVVVASALEEGGTWAGAVESIKHNLAPLIVRDAPNVPEGNRRLIKMGGVRLQKAADLGSALESAKPAQSALL